MSVLINASTSSGLVQTADTSGTLELQSNGTTQLTVSSTGAYGQLKQGTAVASTSGTSIDFTGIPSWVKRITVIFDSVSTNGSSIVQVQLGYSGGVVTSGYASAAQQSGSGNTGTAGFVIDSSVGATNVRSGNMVICNISTNKWTASGAVTISSSNVGSFGGVSPALSGALDRIRITTVNGTDTFDAGFVNILYEG